VEALAEHKPFFTARVSQTLLASFLGKRGTTSDRELATPLQHDQASRLNRIQATDCEPTN
jgi:hypothetical protein